MGDKYVLTHKGHREHRAEDNVHRADEGAKEKESGPCVGRPEWVNVSPLIQGLIPTKYATTVKTAGI